MVEERKAKFVHNERRYVFTVSEFCVFQNLVNMTVQIHEGPLQAANVDRVISAIVKRFPKIQINMELQTRSSSEVQDWRVSFKGPQADKF